MLSSHPKSAWVCARDEAEQVLVLNGCARCARSNPLSNALDRRGGGGSSGGGTAGSSSSAAAAGASAGDDREEGSLLSVVTYPITIDDAVQA